MDQRIKYGYKDGLIIHITMSAVAGFSPKSTLSLSKNPLNTDFGI